MAIHGSYKGEGFLDFTLDDLEVEEHETKPVFGFDGFSSVETKPVFGFDDFSSVETKPVFGFDDFSSVPASLSGFSESQLCVPDDPIEDLEWFPNFTNEPISLSGIPMSFDHETVFFKGFPKTPERETEENNDREVPRKGFEGRLRQVIHSKKTRSKRVVGRSWASMKSRSSSPEMWPGKNVVLLGRRCTHCQVEKTPQWRTGPMGPKTLCNACGVRYKSGRLVPEYRPASSPSFNQEVHSNSHKKIMKMREVKDG